MVVHSQPGYYRYCRNINQYTSNMKYEAINKVTPTQLSLGTNATDDDGSDPGVGDYIPLTFSAHPPPPNDYMC